MRSFPTEGFYTCAITEGATTQVSNEAQLVVASTAGPAGSGSGLRGTYYDNIDFIALRRARVDTTVNFAWGAGSPSSTMQPDTFSARWTGQVQPRYTQNYKFHTRTDDGVRLWVNGVLLIDKWQDQGAEWRSASIALTAGEKYDLVLEYFENGGDATCQLYWSAYSLLRKSFRLRSSIAATGAWVRCGSDGASGHDPDIQCRWRPDWLRSSALVAAVGGL
jgi:hypothetical protein